MCTIRERTNSFAASSNWISKLSYSIKELFDTTNTPVIWKNVGIRELSNLIRDLSNKIGELSN